MSGRFDTETAHLVPEVTHHEVDIGVADASAIEANENVIWSYVISTG